MITWALLAVAVVSALLYCRWRYSYWSSRGVPTASGCIPFLGHMGIILSKNHSWITLDKIYKENIGSGICGLYWWFNPTAMIYDLDLVKAVLIKDFDHFADRRSMKLTNSEDKIFNEMLTVTTGSHWKGIRSVLTTNFTTGRMKGMFPLVEAKAQALVDYIHKQLQKDSVVPIKKDFGLYTMEVISSCAFGLETDSFSNDDSEFLQKARELFHMSFKQGIKIVFLLIFPKLLQILKIQISHENISYFADIIHEMMKRRKEGVKRGDFLDIMMETMEEQNEDSDRKKPKYALSNDAVVASSLLFIIAGFDNTANTLAFAAFLLAKNPETQDRLREELREILAENGTLTYQGIMEAKYLEGCLSETLRLYPPGHVTERKCTKSYKLPGRECVIEKGQIISVPIWSLHHDERYWPEPNKFDPSRFLPENKDKIYSGSYLPFGLGPRNCIAMRFAQMESKLALARLVLDFNLQCAPGHEEIQLSKIPGVLRPKEDVHLVLTTIAKE